MKILDSLSHVTSYGTWFHADFDASENRLLSNMDDAHVEKLWLSHRQILSVMNRFLIFAYLIPIVLLQEHHLILPIIKLLMKPSMHLRQNYMIHLFAS